MRPILVRKPLAIAVGLLVTIAVAIVLVVLLMPSESSSTPVRDLYDEPTATVATPPTATPTRRSVLATDATPTPVPPLYIAPVARMRIPSIGVDAPVQTKGIDAGNTMENPDGPEDVAWYDFTAKPGLGVGNAVFSGHLDFINYGKAVFGDIEDLVEGDVIEVVLEDGTIIQFAVTALQSYSLADIPMAEVLAVTSSETVTLITCTGQFSGGVYSHRLVVRAIRTGLVPAPAS